MQVKAFITDSTALPFMRKFQPVRNAPHLACRAFRRPRFNIPTDTLQSFLSSLSGESALPDDYQIPSRIAPRRFVADITLDVLRPLIHPELYVRFGHGRILAAVPMPEASAHIDNRPRLGNHDIRPARETPVAHPVPPTAREQAFAHEQFRQSIFTSDHAHAFMPLFFRELIHSIFIQMRRQAFVRWW